MSVSDSVVLAGLWKGFLLSGSDRGGVTSPLIGGLSAESGRGNLSAPGVGSKDPNLNGFPIPGGLKRGCCVPLGCGTRGRPG